MKYETKAGERSFAVEIEDDGTLLVDGAPLNYDFQAGGDPHLFSLLLDHHSYELRVAKEADQFRVLLNGENILVEVFDERRRRLENLKAALGESVGEQFVKAPMPGLVVDVLVRAGDSVSAGQTLVILESMKMHNEFKTKADAVVKQVCVGIHDKVQRNDTLVILE